MQDWQLRVVAERDELKKKLDNLSIFTNTAAFEAMHPIDSSLMVQQAAYMANYLHALNMRIVRFEVAE